MSLRSTIQGFWLLPLCLALVPAACSVGDPALAPAYDGSAGGTDPGSSAEPVGCDGPIGAAQDPSTLTACCPDVGGHHCVDAAGEKLESLFGACDGGGFCIADDYIRTGGVVSPKTCASIGGAPGSCLSVCAPKVAEKVAILPTDVCEEGIEVCVPCISPLDGLSTGACELTYTCEGGYGANEPPEMVEPTCPHEGPPVIDPETKESCNACGTGHCIANADIPADKQSMFGKCDDYQLCVPDKLISTGGNYVAPTCDSIGGAEGRCMSTCMPDVAKKEGSLPQSSCDAEELCVPCFDPVDGKDTGVCKLSCDPGPAEPPTILPTCCGEVGSCFPKTSVPQDKLADLPTEGCEDEASVCLPHVFMEDEIKLQQCETVLVANLFGEEYRTGVCMPECLPAVDSFVLHQDNCPASYKCAPCLSPPYGEPSGACAL
jgi:hypothetical protein